ncbi:glycosyltransferase family 2 protein [Flavobacteriaceae bacterium LMO-SS05]
MQFDCKNITIVILNYNSSKDTIELYTQIKEFYKGLSIIIVDNNSELKDKNNLALNVKNEEIIYISKNIGYAGGNNIGIRKALEEQAEYVWILNPDIRLENNTLTILMETIQKNKNVAAVGPRICYRNDKNRIYSDGGIINKRKGFETAHFNSNKIISELKTWQPVQRVDYVNGSAMLVKTSVIKKIGFMMEDFFLYFEEAEWCLRATKNNFKLLVNTDALAYHASSEKGELYAYYMTRNRILLAKHEKEYFFTTVNIVWKKVYQHLKKDIRKRKITLISQNLLKGFVAGIIGKLNRI